MRQFSTFAVVTCSVKAQSDDSILCLFEEDTDDEQEIWVPKEHLDPDESLDDLDEKTELNIATWWLERNSIEYK